MQLSKKQIWSMWLIVTIFYAYQYILRVMFGTLFDEIVAMFQVDALKVGQLSGIYYVGYALAHLPLGIFLDKYGPKKIVPIFIIFVCIGLIPFAFGMTWSLSIAGRLLIGIGSSAAILSVFKVCSVCFGEKLFPRMLSFSIMLGLTGALYGGGPLSYAHQQFGFQNLILGLIAGGVLLAAVAYFILPKESKQHKNVTVESELKHVLLNFKVIALCVFAGLMVGPLEGFADVWGAPFFKNVYGYDNDIASSFPTLIFVGLCFGAPAFSYVAEKIGHVSSMIISAVLMLVSFIWILHFQLSTGFLTALLIEVGVLSAYQIIAVARAAHYVKPQYFSLATALANMIIMIFGYVFHSLIGVVVHGYPEGSSEGFITGLNVIPICLSVAAVGLIIFKLSKQDR